MTAITITAPAKINLFLSVINKRDNGYHDLQSLVAFTKNFGDTITISPADKFSFSFDSTAEHLPTDGNNLVICAANLLADALNKPLNLAIHLSKKIPMGAGLGGGSSDAAATIKGLLQFWQISDIPENQLNDILLNLGADVPTCYHAQVSYFEGIGEIITPLENFPTCHALLVYPNQHSSTPQIFENFTPPYSQPCPRPLPTNFTDINMLIEFLNQSHNDLTSAAIKQTPQIDTILKTLTLQSDCLLNRMSGSGSACFGLFKTHAQARNAMNNLQLKHPDWWLQQVEI